MPPVASTPSARRRAWRTGGSVASCRRRLTRCSRSSNERGAMVGHFFVGLRNFAIDWWPLFLIVFYALMLYLFWRVLALMPRVKPAKVETGSASARFDEVAGLDEAKAELLEIVEFLRDPKRFTKLGARVPKGLLLYGPPGTGKTLLAKAAANESGANFYAASASSFVEMFAGLGAARIRKLFEEARKNAPAAIFAGRKQLQYIRQADFEGAMERVVAGLQQRRVVTDKEKRILAYHEGGHALMAHLMGELMQLQKVSIVARGDALGYAYYLPDDERYLRTKEELVDMMKVALAGRAAEQIVFGRVTNGASNDLEKVTSLARQMVFEFGMSDVATSRTMRADNYALSEETKRTRDQEQARLTDEAYDEALRLLFKHRGPLDRVAAALLDKETLDRDEVLALLADVQPESSASETVGTPQAVIPLAD